MDIAISANALYASNNYFFDANCFFYTLKLLLFSVFFNSFGKQIKLKAKRLEAKVAHVYSNHPI